VDRKYCSNKKPLHGKSKNKCKCGMKKRKDGTSPYYTNKAVKEKIDKLLHDNSKIWSNLGTGTTLDNKSREEGEKSWAKIANKIKELDEMFFNSICPYGIDS
tara:strand:+ start:395 stop:700 length:306 start_codon:yes stop_codon:yes gene_type:complete